MIGGVAYAYKAEADGATAPPTMTHFADVHGTPAQRFYNVLCIAYDAGTLSCRREAVRTLPHGPALVAARYLRERDSGIAKHRR